MGEVVEMEKNEDKISVKIMKKELEEKLQKMVEDRDAKCKAAKEQLIEMLEVTADKYRTATGTAEALRVLRFTYGADDVDIATACQLAYEMAIVTNKMKDKATKIGYAEMDQLCDGFYEKEFKTDSQYALAREMMHIDLCRNVGGAAEDMVSFINRVQEEIDQTQEALDELNKEEE